MTPAVLVTDYAWASLDIERGILAEVGAELVVAETGEQEELVTLAGGVEAILTNWKPVTARVLTNAPLCKTVVRYGVGLDNIDVPAATELGMVVSNVPDYCMEEVSDHVIALVLALTRHIVEFAVQTRGGGWNNQEFGTPHRLRGQTLGLVGFGRIARLVASKAQGLGMSVIAYTPRLSAGDHDGVRAVGSLDELLGLADAISLHAPLTDETRQMIGAAELGRLRPGALLVNTARGALVDESALCAALESGALGGAGLDVMDEEPAPSDHPLRHTRGVIMTPHAAFYSAESVCELQEKAARNVVTVLSGGWPATTVNPEVAAVPGLRLGRR